MTRNDRAAVTETVRLQQSSFEDYYRVHRGPIFRALNLTLGDWDLAAEATDEAMARTYSSWRSVRTYPNAAGWTYRVGLNWARSRFRGRMREVAGDVPDRAQHPPDIDPQLVAALATLDLEYRSVLVLKYYLEMSQPEIAAALGLPEGTVKSRLSRGLDQLRKKWGVTR